MWSLGAIWLEIATGFPMWLSLKSKIRVAKGYSVYGSGLFAVAGREHSKILQKQYSLLKHGVKQCAPRFFDGLLWMKSSLEAIDLLERMLCADPKARISPGDALSHPFLQEPSSRMLYI